MAAFYTLQTSARLRALRHGFWEIFTPANIGGRCFNSWPFSAPGIFSEKICLVVEALTRWRHVGERRSTLRMVFLRWLNLLGGILPSVGFLVFLYLLFHVTGGKTARRSTFCARWSWLMLVSGLSGGAS
jgi:hypothetical protein